MRCPGCPPSVSPSPCFSWPSSTQQGVSGRKQAACIFSNELSKQELAHLLVREARRISQCRASGVPYQSPLQLAIARASKTEHTAEPMISTSDISTARLVRRSGPYVPIVHRSTPVYMHQCLPSTQHPVARESVHRRPRTAYSAHTEYISSARKELLPEEARASHYAQHKHSPVFHYSSYQQADSAYNPRACDHRVQGSNAFIETSSLRAPMSAPHSSRATIGGSGGKRRAYLNPNGFEDGFISMPGSHRTSSVSDSCHINPRLYGSEYRQSSSSYCHFRPGLGNTYFYN